MKIKRRIEFKPEVATSSLNDIMFFLLLFFLIVSTFANPNVIKIFLPKADFSHNVPKKQITLTITADKKIFIDTEPIAFDNLYNKLIELKNSIHDVTIVVRADQSLTVQDLVEIMQVGTRANVRLVLATQKKS